MADFEEDSVFTEGVRAFEATDPARFDVLNNTIKPLVDRTRYLYDSVDELKRFESDLANPDKGAAMVARGVVAVDSIADLLGLPALMRRRDLRYLVESYTGGWGAEEPYVGPVGGGEFYWDPSNTDEPDGVLTFGDGPTGRFKRIYDSAQLQDIACAGYNYRDPTPQGDRVQAALNAFARVTTRPGAAVNIGASEIVVPNTCTLEMGDGSYFVSTTMGTAVRVLAGQRERTGISNLRTRKRTAISVWRSSEDWSSGLDLSSEGIVIEDNRYSDYVLSAQNFRDNIVLDSDISRQQADPSIWNGIVGCDFAFPMVRNGKRNLVFRTPNVLDSGTGYINQNNFSGGTLRHDSYLVGQGTINIDLDTGNGNTFNGLNLEGNSSQLMRIRYNFNAFINCRMEGSVLGNVFFMPSSYANIFIGGYGNIGRDKFEGAVDEQIIFGYRGTSLSGSTSHPALMLWGEASGATKVISVRDLTKRIRAEVSGVGIYEGYGTAGKQAPDNPSGNAYPSVVINPNDRSLSLGLGNADPSGVCRLREESGRLHLYGISTLRPQNDNAVALGSSGGRWSQVYAGNGTINTSDEREKEQQRDLSESERRVAHSLKGLLRAFKWKHAVAEKGDAARWHFGVMAQEVAAAFAAEGLDAAEYGLFCYDEWPEQPEILDEDGNVQQEFVAAGNRYGVRYDQMLAFIIAAL